MACWPCVVPVPAELRRRTSAVRHGCAGSRRSILVTAMTALPDTAWSINEQGVFTGARHLAERVARRARISERSVSRSRQLGHSEQRSRWLTAATAHGDLVVVSAFTAGRSTWSALLVTVPTESGRRRAESYTAWRIALRCNPWLSYLLLWLCERYHKAHFVRAYSQGVVSTSCHASRRSLRCHASRRCVKSIDYRDRARSSLTALVRLPIVKPAMDQHNIMNSSLMFPIQSGYRPQQSRSHHSKQMDIWIFSTAERIDILGSGTCKFCHIIYSQEMTKKIKSNTARNWNRISRSLQSEFENRRTKSWPKILHCSQRIKLKYHKIIVSDLITLFKTRHNGNHDRIASGPNRKEDLLKSKVVRWTK